MWPFGGRFFPGTNLQDLNLDWLVQRVRDLSRGIIAPFINSANQHWMVWDTDAETFVDSGVSAAGEGAGPQGEPGKSPIIGSNGNWYTWDPETEAYTDTGITAQGPAGPEGQTGPEGPRAGNNLLINWYFVGGGSQLGDGIFPINQRGQTVYSNAAGYTIDRWKLTNDKTVLTVADDGIQLDNETASAYCINRILTKINGCKVTLSVLLSDGTLQSASAAIPANNPSATTVYANINGIAQIIYLSGIWYVRLTGNHLKYKAIKLELGDTQTLAHQENGEWVINELPDYAEELAKCQRYLCQIRGDFFSAYTVTADALFFPLPLPQAMSRTAFTLTALSDATMSVISLAGTVISDFEFLPAGIFGNIAHIQARKTAHGISQGALTVRGGDYLISTED